MSHNYECAHIEAENDFICEPWSIEYVPITGNMPHNTPEELWNSCEQRQKFLNYGADEALCATQACVAETHFVDEMTDFLVSGNMLPNLEHKNGFNVTSECVHVFEKNNSGNGGGNGGGGNKDSISGYQGDGGQISDKECCGAYPKKFPYHPVSSAGFKQCCVDKTYNDLVHVCCDGQIKSFCS